VGESVYVKIQPYVQALLAQRSNQKLAFKFFGPYRITAKVGNLAYWLEFPASSSVHPVFHVSQLKKAVSARHSVTSVPPSADVLWSVLEKILQKRSVTKGTHSILQGLVKWSNLPVSLATWEDLEFLQQQFPCATIWSRLGAQGRGGVTDAGTEDDTIAHPTSGAAVGPQPGRSSRPKLPSTRVTGNDWATP
jgi:hypothetical protein